MDSVFHKILHSGWLAPSRSVLRLEVDQAKGHSRKDSACRIGKHFQPEAFQLHKQLPPLRKERLAPSYPEPRQTATEAPDGGKAPRQGNLTKPYIPQAPLSLGAYRNATLQPDGKSVALNFTLEVT